MICFQGIAGRGDKPGYPGRASLGAIETHKWRTGVAEIDTIFLDYANLPTGPEHGQALVDFAVAVDHVFKGVVGKLFRDQFKDCARNIAECLSGSPMGSQSHFCARPQAHSESISWVFPNEDGREGCPSILRVISEKFRDLPVSGDTSDNEEGMTDNEIGELVEARTSFPNGISCSECDVLYFRHMLGEIVAGKDFSSIPGLMFYLRTHGKYFKKVLNSKGQKLFEETVWKQPFGIFPPISKYDESPAPLSFHDRVESFVGYSLARFLIHNNPKKLKRCGVCSILFIAKDSKRKICYSQECKRKYKSQFISKKRQEEGKLYAQRIY